MIIFSPKRVEDPRGTLVVLESQEVGFSIFETCTLVEVFPQSTHALPAGIKQVVVPVRGTITLESEWGETVAVASPNDLVEIADNEQVSIAGGEYGVRFVVLGAFAGESANRFEPPEIYSSPIGISGRSVESPSGVIETRWGETCPFPIRRIYFTHSAASGSQRGGHAHRRLKQILIAMDGSIELGFKTRIGSSDVTLSSSHEGVYVAPLTWRDITMGDDGFLFVLASEEYSEGEYIRDEREFMTLIDQTSGASP